ncbi:hypothetical protein BJV82DRAFT_579213 [Fennellomyces sp. T-0311]|nr:hypothetical protein BJV82DRAFT_579213 [Fennellomyces sp. T-0311]
MTMTQQTVLQNDIWHRAPGRFESATAVVRGDGEILSREGELRCPLKDSEVPEFKPTWLVRVSDMQVVPGSSVDGHYWALSYSWNQSGELIHKGGEDYDRIDEGKHQIIEYKGTRTRTIQHGNFDVPQTITEFDPATESITLVTFQGLVQQICKDFDIEYIWFDQLCIDQNDHDAKMHEIKQMHTIYKNARCTVAVVPEFQWARRDGGINAPYANVKDIPNTQWCKRIWTLEEAYVSEHILFLGNNVHMWSNVNTIWKATTSGLDEEVFMNKEPWIACTALWDSSGDDKIMAVRQKEASVLPSWTGANGAHVTQFSIGKNPIAGTPDYTIAGDCLRLTSSFVTIRTKAASAVEKPDDFHNRDKYRLEINRRDKNIRYKEYLDKKLQRSYRYMEDGLPFDPFSYDWKGSIADGGSPDLTFVSTTSKSHHTYDSNYFLLGLHITHVLPMVEEVLLFT